MHPVDSSQGFNSSNPIKKKNRLLYISEHTYILLWVLGNLIDITEVISETSADHSTSLLKLQHLLHFQYLSTSIEQLLVVDEDLSLLFVDFG